MRVGFSIVHGCVAIILRSCFCVSDAVASHQVFTIDKHGFTLTVKAVIIYMVWGSGFELWLNIIQGGGSFLGE